VIRDAVMTDVPELRELMARCPLPSYPVVDDESIGQSIREITRILQQRLDKWKVLVVDDGERLVGYTIMEECERAIGRPHRFMWWHQMYVEPDHRERSEERVETYARAMTRTLFRWARERGVEFVEGEAHVGDARWNRRQGHAYAVKHYCVIADVLDWMERQERLNG